VTESSGRYVASNNHMVKMVGLETRPVFVSCGTGFGSQKRKAWAVDGPRPSSQIDRGIAPLTYCIIANVFGVSLSMDRAAQRNTGPGSVSLRKKVYANTTVVISSRRSIERGRQARERRRR
jgi:hypothetical protein